MRSISSRQNPIVRTFRDLAAGPPDDGYRLLLDGIHLVQEARAAGMTIPAAAVLGTLVDDPSSPVGSLAALLERDGTEVFAVTRGVMTIMSPVRSPSGIVAIAERQPVDPGDIYNDPDALIVVAVNVQDPGNVGALVRTAEALGATGVIACGACANPFSWKALRGSMGSVLRLPLIAGVPPGPLLTVLGDAGVMRVGSATRGGRPPSKIDWSRRVAVFVGSEGAGLDDTLLAQCDERVTIPLRPPVGSLNVAVASALLLDEARRAREADPRIPQS